MLRKMVMVIQVGALDSLFEGVQLGFDARPCRLASILSPSSLDGLLGLDRSS